MATARLLASAYQLSNTSYLNISNASNMYTNVDSSTYAQVNHTRNQTTSYYIYIRGFDFSSLPSNATITSAIVKIKALESGASTATPGLYNNTTSLSKNLSGTITTSAQTRTVDITSNWDTYKGYGANFGIRLQLNRSSRNTASYLRIYGAEITVEYTVPQPVVITTSATGDATIDPSGTTNLVKGDSFSLRIDASGKPTVLDNNVDVSNNLIEKQSSLDYTVTKASGASYEFVYNNTTGYWTSNNKGVSSSAAVSVVSFSLPVKCTVNFHLINYAEATYDYGLLSNVDTTLTNNYKADTSNVFWSGSSHNSASEQVVTYSSVSAGDHSIYVKFFKDSYTNSNNDTLQFYVEIVPEETLPSNSYYIYELTNLQEDHVIVVSYIADTNLRIKDGGSWKKVLTVYKKVNGSWIEIQASTLDKNVKYIRKGSQITASDFDNLRMTVGTFDNLRITTENFDNNAKKYLGV